MSFLKKTDSDGVQVVLFDYGQVLSTPPNPAAWTRMQALSGLSDRTLHEAYWALRHNYDRGVFTGQEYWHSVGKQAGVAFSDDQIKTLLVADVDLWAEPNSPMIDWAARLQHSGMRTAILSNIGDAMAEGLTARLKWLAKFERCVWSYAFKMAKPEPQIFQMTAELLRVRPEQILFVDDKAENVAAAEDVGMRALQYAGHETFLSAARSGFPELWDLGAPRAVHTRLTSA